MIRCQTVTVDWDSPIPKAIACVGESRIRLRSKDFGDHELEMCEPCADEALGSGTWRVADDETRKITRRPRVPR